MIGYEVQSMEVRGQALVAQVRFERADGRVRDQRYSWPVGTSRREIQISLKKFFQDFAAEPSEPESLHPAMELVGQPEDLSHLDRGRRP